MFIPCKPSNVILSKMSDLALRADLKEATSKTSVLKRLANYAGVCSLCMARVNFKSILGVFTGMMNP